MEAIPDRITDKENALSLSVAAPNSPRRRTHLKFRGHRSAALPEFLLMSAAGGEPAIAVALR
jgi:hypothetical protein